MTSRSFVDNYFAAILRVEKARPEAGLNLAEPYVLKLQPKQEALLGPTHGNLANGKGNPCGLAFLANIGMVCQAANCKK